MLMYMENIIKSIDNQLKKWGISDKILQIVLIIVVAYIIAQLLGIFKFHVNYSF